MFDADSMLSEIASDPVFGDFGRLLFPTGRSLEGLTLRDLKRLLPYHSNLSAEESARAINALAQRAAGGEQIFYRFYPQDGSQKSSTDLTGLFFVRGKPGAPYAVICAGGGFSYVGAIHESLPHALYLAERGYNAFALIYRTPGADVALADLAAALTFIDLHADEFEIDRDHYSLWGGSAGARMAAYLGSYGVQGFGRPHRMAPPDAVIMQYTGHRDYTEHDPPTYAVVGRNDPIANYRVMQERIEALQECGIDAKIKICDNLGHGFGPGIGTSAEGWIDEAVAFWEKQMKKEPHP